MCEPSHITTVVAAWLLQTIPAIEELEAAGREDLASSLAEILTELYRLYSDRLPDLPAEFTRLGAETFGCPPHPPGRLQ